MGRILAIDYGKKRVGIAVTDPMQIIANGLTTVRAHDIIEFLSDYFKMEVVDKVVIGYPKTLKNEGSESLNYINPFIKNFRKKFPEKLVELVDERFTSKLAMDSMIAGGMKKSDRQNKELIDEISATIILQSYMDSLSYRK